MPRKADLQGAWATVSTTIEVFFYEPLNTIKQPTPILQVYSNAGLPWDSQDYRQPTPTNAQQGIDAPLHDAGGFPTVEFTHDLQAMPDAFDPPERWPLDVQGTIGGRYIHATYAQPNVQMIKEPGKDGTFASSVKFKITFGRSLQNFGAVPSIPPSMKIVCGFLENSYHRSV